MDEANPVAAGSTSQAAVPLQRFGRVELFGAHPIPPARLLRITDAPPDLRIVPDAVVTRMTRDRPQWRARQGDPARLRGTVYDAAGLPVSVRARDQVDSRNLLIVYDDEPVLAGARREAAETLPGRHVYAGDLKQHFGHFMLESLCRAWAFDRAPGGKLIFHSEAADPRQAIAPFMFFFLEAFGIGPQNILVADRDLRVEELVVPSSQYDVVARADVRFAAVFDRIRRFHVGETESGSLRRLYFSRRAVDEAALAKLRRTDRPGRARRWAFGKIVGNEAAVERLFAARGFAVVAPEALPLARQLALAAGAEMLAGVTGTALHHALFTADPDARIISVATRFAPNQVAIEQIKGVASAHLFCAGPRVEDAPVPIDLDRLATLLDKIGLGG